MLAAVALPAAPVRAADTVVAQLLRPTAVAGFAGIEAFSAFDGTVYHLLIRRAGVLQAPPVAPSRAPFDVDVGPDTAGRPQLVYTRCSVEKPIISEGRNESRGCDLVVFSLAGGGVERPVRNANTTANEFAPTLWRGRIVFARAPRTRARPVVYTRMLTDPRSRRSKRLPGVVGQVAGQVRELELYGRNLAQVVSFVSFTQKEEVRLVDVRRSRSRLMQRTGVGEGGQFFAGIGFASGRLFWALNCISCSPRPHGIYRRRLSTNALARAPRPAAVRAQVVGLAPLSSDAAYVTDAEVTTSGCGDDAIDRPLGCHLIRSTELPFRPVR